MNIKSISEIELQVKQIVEDYIGPYGKTRDFKNTFIPLSFFLDTKIKNEELLLTTDEFDVIRQFRRLSFNEQRMFVDMLKKINQVSGNNYRRDSSINEFRKEALKKYRKGNNSKCFSNRYFYGYCYIGVDSNWSGFYKIGRTSDPTCKTRTGHSINPNYKILYRTKDFFSDAGAIEYEIHESLKQNNIQADGFNEWFKLSDEELNNIIHKYNFVKIEEL